MYPLVRVRSSVKGSPGEAPPVVTEVLAPAPKSSNSLRGLASTFTGNELLHIGKRVNTLAFTGNELRRRVTFSTPYEAATKGAWELYSSWLFADFP